VGSGAAKWLAPTQSDYYYVELEGSKSGYLAILSVTDARDIAKLDRKIDPSLLKSTGNGFFALSKEMFLKNVVLPTLPACFGHQTNDKTFAYHAPTQSIRSTGWFGANQVKSGLIWYSPKIESFLLTVHDSGLACNVSGSCDMGLDIVCNYMVASTNTLQFDAGSKALTFQKGSPSVQHDFHIPWYDYLIPGIIGIGDAILAIVVSAIADGIAGGLMQDAGNFSLAKEPPQSVQWNGVKGFNVTAAGLADSFFMRGEFAA
jgi:hypothetical protein